MSKLHKRGSTKLFEPAKLDFGGLTFSWCLQYDWFTANDNDEITTGHRPERNNAMTKYFVNCKTLDELKKVYKHLAQKHHPDVGGDTATMQAINAEYEARFEVLKRSQNEQAAEDTTGKAPAPKAKKDSPEKKAADAKVGKSTGKKAGAGSKAAQGKKNEAAPEQAKAEKPAA